jgi:hypothetical protein
VRETDNLTAMRQPILYIMWDPQHPTTLQASMTCYGDSFPLLYVDDDRTSQEARPVTGIASLLYLHDVRTSQEARPVTGIASLLYLDDVRTSQEARPVTGIASLLYSDDVRTSQEARPVTGIALLFVTLGKSLNDSIS